VIRAAALLLLVAAPALAQPASRPGLGAEEARRPVAVAQAPWSSLVRVQTDAGTRCSGVLLAPDRVLTAAHCLVAPATGRVVQPGRVHALLGYDRGEYRAHAVGRSLRLGPGFDPASRGPIGADWAVLRLATPLPGPALPLAPLPAAGTSAMLGGWQQDRAHALLADTACRVEARLRDAAGRVLLRHDCAGTRGSSGGPLLVRHGDGWAIAGIAAGAVPQARGGIAVAVEGLALDGD
jgi:protease YdgD